MNRIKLTTDYINPRNLKKELTIIHLSDIHFSINTTVKELNRISNYINKIKPDYIMITGDTIDEPWITKNPEIKELLTFLSNLSHITKVLISIGNHDIILNEDIKFFKKLDDINNIYVLDNKNYYDEYINVLGITLPNCYYYNCSRGESADVLVNFLDNINLDIKKDVPNVLMVHSPIKLTNSEVIKRIKDYDLVLTGHTHAGMVPDILKWLFPKNMGIISPQKELFPKIAKGKIIKDTTTIIINGAITKLSNRSGISKLNFIYNKDINKIILSKEKRK